MSSTPLSLRMRLAQSKFRGRGTRRGRWRTFEINIVLVRDGKNVIPLVGLDGLSKEGKAHVEHLIGGSCGSGACVGGVNSTLIAGNQV